MRKVITGTTAVDTPTAVVETRILLSVLAPLIHSASTAVVSIRSTRVCEYVRYLNLDVPAYLYGTAWYRTTAVHVQAVLLNLAALVLVLKVITGTTAVDMPTRNPGTTIRGGRGWYTQKLNFGRFERF